MALIDQMTAKTGRQVKEDSTIVNAADYLGITTAYYSGTVGADIIASGTSFRIANDTAEPITVKAGNLTMKFLQSDRETVNVAAFTKLVVAPTTSAGTKQAETATLAVGNVTTAGDMAVIITAANLSGSPKTILVPVTLDDVTPSLIMAKVRAAVAADAGIIPLFTVTGTGADIVLTATHGLTNDTSLNVDLAGTGTTAVGITQAGTSTNTTGGSAGTTIGYRLWVRN